MARFSWKRPPEADHAMRPVSAAVPLLQELRPLYDSELRRARRYERPLSLIMLTIDSIGGAGSNGKANSGEPRSNGNGRSDSWAQQSVYLGQLLQHVLRETDLLAYIPGSHEFVALLPEADRVGADEAGERIRRLWSAQQGALQLNLASAAYPGGGLQLDDLIESARSVLRNRRKCTDQTAAAHRTPHG